MSFGRAIASFFRNYFNFRGRARRSEFWYAMLFYMLVEMVFYIPIMLLLNGGSESEGAAGFLAVAYAICAYGMMIPVLSVQIRRFHDIGMPWTTYLLYLIPIANIVYFFKFNMADSDGDNQWGPSPKYEGSSPNFYTPQNDYSQYGRTQNDYSYYTQGHAQPYYGQQPDQPRNVQPQYYQPGIQPQGQNAQPQYYQPGAQPQGQNAQPQYYQPHPQSQDQYGQPQNSQQYYQPGQPSGGWRN